MVDKTGLGPAQRRVDGVEIVDAEHVRSKFLQSKVEVAQENAKAGKAVVTALKHVDALKMQTTADEAATFCDKMKQTEGNTEVTGRPSKI